MEENNHGELYNNNEPLNNESNAEVVEENADYKSGEYSFIPPKEEAVFSTNPQYNNESTNTVKAPIEKSGKEQKRGFSFGAVIACCLVAAIVAGSIGALVGLNFGIRNYDNSNTSTPITSNSGSGSNTVINVDETTNSNIAAVAAKVTPSVVGIATTAATTSFFGGTTESTGEGSGVIYSSDGYIITNYHVIEEAVKSSSATIAVYLSSDTTKSYKATVVGYNISYDLAVIKISAGNKLPKIDLANANSLKVGQYVAAIGSPGGLEFMGSVTYGIISGLNRVISDSTSGASVKLIQTDAAINPGNSGGALVNTSGKLIGINSSKIAATAYEGMGFAIPVDTVKSICDKIIAKENDPNPYIGITISERYTADLLTSLGYPAGAVVKSVISGGPAANAGIKSGDIIVEFAGVAISEYSVLNDQIAQSTPGKSVTVKIYRSGRYYSTSVKIGSNNSQ